MGRVRPRGFGLQRGEPSLVKIVDGVANRLVIAAKGPGNGRSRLPLDAGKQHLAAADGKTTGRPKPDFQPCLLLGREWPNKKWRLHIDQYTTCPIISLEIALGNSFNCRYKSCFVPYL